MSARCMERSESARGFARTLGFGALAASTLPLSTLVLAPVLGGARALALHAVLAAAGYLAVMAPDARRRVAVAAGGGAAGLLCLAWAGSNTGLLVALSLVVAVVRSGVLFRRGLARSLAVEGIVLLLAVATLHVLAVPGLAGRALALWGWFVVQSFYFLPAGLAARARGTQGDPFERARRRLEELLAG